MGLRIGKSNRFAVGGSKIAGFRGTITYDADTSTVIELMRTLDRTWASGAGATPGSGGGNVQPDRFTYDGENWECWQVVPFLGTGVNPPSVGDCRVHLRNRDINRGQMLLEDMPDRVILKMDGWTDSPWEFTRPTAGNKFINVGSGNSARKGIDYEPRRTITGTPTSVGITQGQTFSIMLIWD